MSSPLKRFLGSKHSIPAALLVFFSILTLLQIHGSSIGIYHKIFNGTEAADSSLIFGTPQSIRSDEWLAETQNTITQSKNDYQEVNSNLRDHDVSVILDIPHDGFFALFEPHNYFFHIFNSVEFALVAKWWFLAWILLTSVYYTYLELTKRSRVEALVFAGVVYLSPIVQWWYQTKTLASIAWALICLLLFLKLQKPGPTKNKILITLGLMYALACYFFIQYPPYQIMTALPVAFFAIGHLVNTLKRKTTIVQKTKELFKLYWPILIAVAFVASLVAFFISSKSVVIDAIGESRHPGNRVFKSGAAGVEYLIHSLSGHLSIYNQSTASVNNYFSNQSELSNAILYGPWLVIVMTGVMWRSLKSKLDFRLVGLGVLMVAIWGWFAVSGVDLIYRPLLFSNIPYARILIGSLMIAILAVPLLINSISKKPFQVRTARILTWLAAITYGYITIHILIKYPGYVRIPIVALVVTVIPVLTVWLFARAKIKLALALLLIFSAISVFRTNPIYQGFDVLTQSNLSQAIRSTDIEGRWAVLGSIFFENQALINGKESITGSQPYPNNSLWEQIDPTGRFERAYNRTGHINAELLPDDEPFNLEKQNANRFLFSFSACSDVVDTLEISALVSQTQLDSRCIEQVKFVDNIGADFYIYRVIK